MVLNDRTSVATMRVNQLRLQVAASSAYVLISALRRIGVAHAVLARPPWAATA